MRILFRMALYMERGSFRFGYQGCGVDRTSTTAIRTSEASCGFPHYERSRTHGLFLRRVFRCPKLQKESLQFRRATISAVASPAAMSSSSSTTPPSLSDHILDRVSCFLLIRGKELLGSTKLDQALDWLPPKLLEQLHRKEAFAAMLLREGLVFGTLFLLYCQVNNSCRGLCSNKERAAFY